MKKLVLLFLLLSLSRPSFSQGIGHPGGGGPDMSATEADLLCASTVEKISNLKEKFVKAWDKKYRSSDDFYDLLDRIVLENIIHSMGKFEESKNKKPHDCNKGQKHLAEVNLSKRPGHKEELATLIEIEAQLSLAKQKKSAICSDLFKHGSDRTETFHSVIKLYEKRSP
jgi:hypothetical protein